MKISNLLVQVLSVGLILSSSTVLGVGQMLHIKDVSFKKESKKVEVVYRNVWRKSETTLTDTGPVLLCVLNRLLTHKYDYYLSLPDGKELTKKDLALITQAARLLPEDENKKMSDSVRNYIQNPSKENGGAVFTTMVSTIRSGLKEHETTWQTVTQVEAASTKELKQKLERVNLKISAFLEGTTESQLDAEEKAVVRKLKRERLTIEEEIADAKPQRKVESGNENPVNYALCVDGDGSKSQTSINNDDVDALLAKVQDTLSQALPEGTGSGSHSTRTHN